MTKDIYSFNSNTEPKKDMKLKIKIHLQKKKESFQITLSPVFLPCACWLVCVPGSPCPSSLRSLITHLLQVTETLPS